MANEAITGSKNFQNHLTEIRTADSPNSKILTQPWEKSPLIEEHPATTRYCLGMFHELDRNLDDIVLEVDI